MLTGKWTLTKIFPDSVSKYVRDGKRGRGEGGAIKLFQREKVDDQSDFSSELRSFAYCRSVQFDVSCRGSIIFCVPV